MTDSLGPLTCFDHNGDDLYVYRRCPKCARFVKADSVRCRASLMEVIATGHCSRCGDIDLVHEYGG